MGDSDQGDGVFGNATAGRGVVGQSTSGAAEGVGGFNNKPAAPAGPGVLGVSVAGIGVHGHSTQQVGVVGDSTEGAGVVGESIKFDGVFGTSRNPNAAGVSGHSLNADGSVNKSGLAGFFDGNLTVTGDILLPGADCAEQFDIAEAERIEPGTVVVIDQEGALRPSQVAYDKKVAGVVSGAGEYKSGIVLDKRASQEGRAPVALVGKVYCKVDAQYAPIEVGDLLTTSATPGHAMKADDPFKVFGAVIGKALRPLREGQAMIPMLIALQ